MKITVYGPGCATCTQAEALVRRVAAAVDPAIEVEKVGDYPRMAAAGVLSTPAFAVDGVMKMAGRVPTEAEITGWITNA